MNRRSETSTSVQDLYTAQHRLQWRLMQARRKAIRAIDRCIGGLLAMRQTIGHEAADALIDDYRSVLGVLVSIRPAALPCESRLAACLDRMRDLQQRLAAIEQSLSDTVRPPAIATLRQCEIELSSRPTITRI